MLSVKRFRELLPSNSAFSDSDVELFRDQLYGLAGLVLDFHLKQIRQPKHFQLMSFNTVASQLSDDEQAALEERAAIIEFDGNVTREQAEHSAIILRFQPKGG